ncbi:MAG: 50S ribosomal protein L22 [Dysgonamonadaceae bacterium]|jgi:large subunit ribosomal protein L22|nr:50S ribosomal protein L22 [Dysgonamonadaceae bacterium]HBN83214.1 50S ribosomal protein L22 [Clostridiales bacterium]MDD3308571.1 50S ribosomal protein L22 [Dysgonamonadaceae bacterium]MDD3899972.1 50S ribosomal protein L22 [Dysgonamonadaceae bacterium]MDD4398669.1 50S ribosomal protein L22 [Dysgonamonadaceae bacterium]
MSSRKRISAEQRKENRKEVALAVLKNVPSSPRKMRYVADLVRGTEVFKALGILKFSNKEASAKVEKLLLSAISNWEQKNERKAEPGELYIKIISVDEGSTLKRLRPAPQGRGYRIRKRSNHVTIVLDTFKKEETIQENEQN